jgi:hypothetical protein
MKYKNIIDINKDYLNLFKINEKYYLYLNY